MKYLLSGVVVFVSLMFGATDVTAVDLEKRLISEFTVERTVAHDKKIEKYYLSLAELIGNDPESLPFKNKTVSVKSGRTLIQLARKNTPRGMDAVHVAAALFMMNREAFLDDDVNKLVSGKELKLPSVAQLFEARVMYEELLSRDKRDEAGFLIYSDPQPRGSKVVSAKKQGRQWKKLSDHQFNKPAAPGPAALTQAATYEEGGGGTVTWQTNGVNRSKVRSQRDDEGTNVVASNESAEHICPYCGLPLSVIKRGKLAGKTVERTASTVDVGEAWQANTSFEQIHNPAQTGAFFISAPEKKGAFTELRKRSKADYDPFSSIINWQFPAGTTVGQAVGYVANYVGYELLVDDQAVSVSYSRQLPVVHRSVEGILTSEALDMLGGKGLVVVTDHSTRKIKHAVGDSVGALEEVRVLGKDDMVICAEDLEVKRSLRKKKTPLVLMLSDGSKCIYL